MLDLSIIRSYEGFREQAYPDPVYGWEVPTIGYGTTHYPDGRAVRLGDTITQAEAEAALEAYVNQQIIPHLKWIPGWSEMSDLQKSALVDFAYNLGARFYGADGFGMISQELAHHDWKGVPVAMLLYSDSGTAVYEGLLRRREAEAAWWRQGMQQSVWITVRGRKAPASSYLTGGHFMVAVRAVADVMGYRLTTAPGTVTITDATAAPHTMMLTITDGVGYVTARDLAAALDMIVTYDAARHVLAFTRPVGEEA